MTSIRSTGGDEGTVRHSTDSTRVPSMVAGPTDGHDKDVEGRVSPTPRPTPSPEPTMLEKKRDAEDATSIDEEKAEYVAPQVKEEEYPSGIQLGFIIFALVLSVFMMSLDMVCISLLHIEPPTRVPLTDLLFRR